MNRRLGGLIPVMTATGPDVTRSAVGRLAGEMALAPTAGWWWGTDRQDEGEFFRAFITSC